LISAALTLPLSGLLAILALTLSLTLLVTLALALPGLLTRLLAVLLALSAGKLLQLPPQTFNLRQLLILFALAGALLGPVVQGLLSLTNSLAHRIHGAIHWRKPSRLVHLIGAALPDILGRILHAAFDVVLLDFADSIAKFGGCIRLCCAQIASRPLDILFQFLQILKVLLQVGCQSLIGLRPFRRAAFAVFGIAASRLAQAILQFLLALADLVGALLQIAQLPGRILTTHTVADVASFTQALGSAARGRIGLGLVSVLLCLL
jgi:hypothetical protein